MRSALILIGLLCLSCSDTTLSPEQHIEPPVTRLYVKVGGVGTGRTAETPAGTIAYALNEAYLDPRIEEIFVAGGTYIESMRIRSSVMVSGSHDPNDGWNVSGPRTIIQGRSIDTLGIACLIVNLSRSIRLDNLDLKGPNPPGEGSSTIAIYAEDVDSLGITNCNIIGGIGKAGSAGQDGLTGAPGKSAARAIPGDLPTIGGDGGAPGPSIPTAQQPGGAGEIGECGGFGTGGFGGGGGLDGNGLPGGRGDDGRPGADGAGAQQLVSIQLVGILDFPITVEADSGATGSPGCGGGGGGGSASVWSPTFSYPGTRGGGAGAGGFGGNAGQAGLPGGHSICIFALHSAVTITNSTITAGIAGKGGDGGNGGAGGIGGHGDANPSIIYWGGRGGDGGNGGQGGFGGGGAGGWSVPVLHVGSRIAVTPNSTLILGVAGVGGAEQSVGNGGAAGKAEPIVEISAP